MTSDEGRTCALYWLPPPEVDWRPRLAALSKAGPSAEAWREAVSLAKYRLNFQTTNALSGAAMRLFEAGPGEFVRTKPERLAVLSSATTTHLQAGLRIGALRRGIWLDVYECFYGQYRQEALARQSGPSS